MYEEVKKFVGGCETCQVFERKMKTASQLHRIPPPKRFNVVVRIDLVGPLPGEKKYAVSIICYLTSWAEIYPVRTTSQRDGLKTLREWIYRYGAPAVIICDSGPTFRTAFEDYCLKKGMSVFHVSVAYPEANGKVERFQGAVFRWIGMHLHAEDEEAEKWVKYVKVVMWGWNTQIKEELGTSPYELVFGQAPVARWEGGLLEDRVISLRELEDILAVEKNEFVLSLRENVIRRLDNLREQEVLRNQGLRVPIGYEPGDQVYLWDKPLESQHSGKFSPKWLGPFVIKEKVGLGSYVLEDESGKVISQGRTYNRDHLKPKRPDYDITELFERQGGTAVVVL